MKVLNPTLYRRLQAAFPGGVKVSGQGVPFIGRLEPDPANQKLKRMKIQQAGEYYCVCCPKCKDTRHRLWINHKWGTEVTQSAYSTKLWHLMVCYNEHCEADEGFRELIFSMIRGKSEFKSAIENVELETEIKKPAPLELTGKYIRVDKLPVYHPAVRYLQEVRDLSAQELGRDWDVMWFEYSPVMPPNNRLFFPFYDVDAQGKQILVGGQSHWLDVVSLNGTPPKGCAEPKWFTLPGTHKSQHLFNGWRARQQDKLVVVVEGPLDCVKLGPEFSVALFGHSASVKQRQLLWDDWGNRGAMGVLALDPDVELEPRVVEFEAWFKSWKNHRILRLPEGSKKLGLDIGDFTHDEAWQLIAETGALDNII